jgi:hypothetical protein
MPSYRFCTDASMWKRLLPTMAIHVSGRHFRLRKLGFHNLILTRCNGTQIIQIPGAFSTSSATQSSTPGPSSSGSTSSPPSQSSSISQAPTGTEIIFDSSTIFVASATSTLVIDNQTIVVGPGGVGVGSETITLPSVTGLTTLTSDGFTFTLEPATPPTSGPVSTSGPSVTSGESSTSGPNSSQTEVIIVGGSSFTIGTGLSTVTVNSQTLVLGPSGIQVGTDSLILPTGATTLTTGRVYFHHRTSNPFIKYCISNCSNHQLGHRY